jgi:hypothetical protein
MGQTKHGECLMCLGDKLPGLEKMWIFEKELCNVPSQQALHLSYSSL